MGHRAPHCSAGEQYRPLKWRGRGPTSSPVCKTPRGNCHAGPRQVRAWDACHGLSSGGHRVGVGPLRAGNSQHGLQPVTPVSIGPEWMPWRSLHPHACDQHCATSRAMISSAAHNAPRAPDSGRAASGGSIRGVRIPCALPEVPVFPKGDIDQPCSRASRPSRPFGDGPRRAQRPPSA